MTITLREHKRQMEAELRLGNSNQNFEQRRGKLHHSYVRQSWNQNVEAEFKFYQSKSSSCKYNCRRPESKERIRGRFINSQKINNQLEEKSDNLKIKLGTWKQKNRIESVFIGWLHKKHNKRSNLNLLSSEFKHCNLNWRKPKIKEKFWSKVTFYW